MTKPTEYAQWAMDAVLQAHKDRRGEPQNEFNTLAPLWLAEAQVYATLALMPPVNDEPWQARKVGP